MATIKQQHTLDDNKIPADQTQKPLLSETYVPQTMPSILGSFDMTALFVCALFFLAYAVLGTSRGLVSLTYCGSELRGVLRTLCHSYSTTWNAVSP